MRQPRKHDEKHLKFIRGLPCICCGDNTSTEAAHIRYADKWAVKRQVGMGEKPDDKWTVPLCGRHHRNQHAVGEHKFWADQNIDPIFAAMVLHTFSGNHEAGEQIVAVHRERRAA